MKRQYFVIFFFFLLLCLAFTTHTSASNIPIDQIWWEPDPNFPGGQLSATLEFFMDEDYTLRIRLTNTTDPNPPVDKGDFDFPSTVAATGFYFQLLGDYAGYEIIGGMVEGSDGLDYSAFWGYDNPDLINFDALEHPDALDVNRGVSTLKADEAFAGDNTIKSPKHGVIPEIYGTKNNYIFHWADIYIDLGMSDPLAIDPDEWEDFLASIGNVVVTFGSSTTPVPEPATLLLLGTGLIGLAGLGRKKFLKKK